MNAQASQTAGEMPLKNSIPPMRIQDLEGRPSKRGGCGTKLLRLNVKLVALSCFTRMLVTGNQTNRTWEL
jgi:hypothetical protein